jgi:hypothetical protein
VLTGPGWVFLREVAGHAARVVVSGPGGFPVCGLTAQDRGEVFLVGPVLIPSLLGHTEAAQTGGPGTEPVVSDAADDPAASAGTGAPLAHTAGPTPHDEDTADTGTEESGDVTVAAVPSIAGHIEEIRIPLGR